MMPDPDPPPEWPQTAAQIALFFLIMVGLMAIANLKGMP